MKKLIGIITIILVLHHLKSLNAPINPAAKTNIKTERIDEVKKLTRVLRHQYKLHCEICKTGKNPKFMRQEPGEFEYRFNRSRDNIERTIQKISTAYKNLGVAPQRIAEQEKQLRDGIYNWV